MESRQYLKVSIGILFGVLVWMFAPQFFAAANLRAMTFTVALLLPAVIGMQLLLISGRFDLSTGSVAALGGIAYGTMQLRSDSVGYGLAFAILVGLIFGLLNFLLTTRFKISPLISTLATMAIARSAALSMSSAGVVGGLPSMYALGTADSVMLSSIFLAIAFLALSAGTLRFVFPLNSLYSVGDNESATRAAGLPVSFLICFGFCAASIGASLCGVLQVSRTSSASPLVFQTLALESIAACIIGGGTIDGGRGSLLGAAVGTWLVVAIRNVISLAGLSVYWREAGVGILLLSAALSHRTGVDRH